MRGKTIDEIQVGDSASFEKTITETDVYQFAGVSGDMNPAHVNERFASQGMFKTRVVHGMLSASLISTVLGTQLPGPGAIYLGQDIKFVKPVFFNDTITARVVVSEIKKDKNICVLETRCLNQHDDVVVYGKATIMPVKIK